ncbi:MAG TPA: spermidine/putrescine ABC transporter substrate-binding protein [Elusimicrobiota bacterium]|jgi:spermidine/putrescine-binding protein|nr:spermidine/putrescine ABC transporter substrate-binding protein [Elusimicrobiota bacterium]
MRIKRFLPVVAAAFLAACGGKKAAQVRLFTWDSYDDPVIFAEFEKLTGLRVVVDRFASNEELLAKLMGGSGGYDIVVPSDYMVSVMARQGLLEGLDLAKVPNLSNIDPRFLKLYYDPENRYSVPYLWGISGIGYDSDQVKPAPTGWDALFDPKYKGRISLMNDQREVFSMALQKLGKSPNSPDPALLEKAKALLVDQKKLVKTYNSESIPLLLISGEVVIAHSWAGEVNRAMQDKSSLRFAIPKEGGFIFQDNLCIPKSAPNKEGALKLVDFLLRPENAARLVQKTGFGTPNKSAWPLLPEALRKNPTLVPQDAVLKKLEWIHDVGDAAGTYDRLWTELKAG